MADYLLGNANRHTGIFQLSDKRSSKPVKD